MSVTYHVGHLASGGGYGPVCLSDAAGGLLSFKRARKPPEPGSRRR